MNLILAILMSSFLSSFNIERTQQGIWQECVRQEILFPDIVTRCAYTETECGLTGVGYSKNNIFGFRDTTGRTSSYQYFSGGIKECIGYYKRWQDRKYPKHLAKHHNNNTCDYYCFIQSTGWKTGKPYSQAEISYTSYMKKIILRIDG